MFQGDLVNMEGHSHPPLNAWFLGLLLAIFGGIREIPFHLAYILFSLIAAVAMWALARRFSPHPFWATLLFIATPAFVINGTSLESDLPFLAFWMAAVALFVAERYILAVLALALASMAAYQAIVLTPILGLYAWVHARRKPVAWAAALTPPLVIAAWQIFEWLSVGQMPIAVMAGYFHTYGFQSISAKLRNAGALLVHCCWIVFPLLLPPAFLLSRKRRDPDTLFLAGWIAIFLAAGLGIFFAGSARYLLPMAAPVALLVSRLNTRWLAAGFAAQMALGVSLAAVNYQHWNGYRQFVTSLKPQLGDKRVWINGEWGLCYYLEAEGGLPLLREQTVRPGDLVVSSELAYPLHFATGGAALAPLANRNIEATLPLRLIALNTRSAYSTVDRGFLPFDISEGPIDRVRAELVVERKPSLSYLPMNAPESEQQLVSGAYMAEGPFRWTAGQTVILLKSPTAPTPLRVDFTIHSLSPARRITLLLDGVKVGEQTYPGPGAYMLETSPVSPAKTVTTLTIVIDQTFFGAGDRRELGIVLRGAGFKER